ncbi:DUF1674 domain-containing protein [Pseudomonadota bacterium]
MKPHKNHSKHQRPAARVPESQQSPPKPTEVGGPKGPEPTRFGDWEHRGRCSDF